MGVIVKGLVGISLATIVAIVAVFLYVLFPSVPPVPKLEETWWGPREPSQEDTEIKPFKINISDEILNDLQQRLDRTLPLQPSLKGVNQNYGINNVALNLAIDFWRTKYNWREREKFLNQYPQYTVSVQGLKIHYIHVKPQNTAGLKVLPLLLLHGWPGSVREFYEIIPLLSKPQKGRDFVFELIIPSLPGYGFSEAAVRPGLGAAQMAVVFKNLMKRLGFEKYYIQGGDWGSAIVRNMAILYPENLLGVHSNLCISLSPRTSFKLILGSIFPSLMVSEKEKEFVYPLLEKYAFQLLESGYMHLQSTKPDTAGVALRDSPVGLAAYILEKFTTWTNPAWKDLADGGLTKRYSLTNLLDNVMIYWVTGSMTTSMRLYSETFNKAHFGLGLEEIPVKVPSGCARFTKEVIVTPMSILEDIYEKLIHVSINDGGHFAAFEVPDVLANDIYEFTEKAERLRKNAN